ncbi:MAG TPA: hypothetical protein VGE41_10690 [Verrucomicrobiae bacterium]|jgi:hypothetical protein
MKSKYIIIGIASVAAVALANCGFSQPVAGSTTDSATGALQPLVDGLAGKYGWLTTLILAIGSLRILFKPLMIALENALQSEPERLARLQKFEAGPIYKTVALVLDLGASIKLPLVRPPADLNK